MIETSDINQIIELIKCGDFKLIGIDGIDGTGKSTLAEKLSVSTGLLHINLDDYIEKEKGNFVDFIDLTRLDSSLNKSPKSTIIEWCLSS